MGEGIRFDVVDTIHGILRGSLCVAFPIAVQRNDVVDLLSRLVSGVRKKMNFLCFAVVSVHENAVGRKVVAKCFQETLQRVGQSRGTG